MPSITKGFNVLCSRFCGSIPTLKRPSSWRRVVLAASAAVELLILLAALSKQAYGYVDPGAGLLAVQVGGSMVAGILFFARAQLRRLLRIRPVEHKQDETAERTGPPSR